MTDKQYKDLYPIIYEYCNKKFSSKLQFTNYKLKACSNVDYKYKDIPTNFMLRQAYNEMLLNGLIERNIHFEDLCKIKSTRENQGVIVFTVVMSPTQDDTEFLSCEYDCHYCPNVPNYARSYYPGEPAVNRGDEVNWDPVKQVYLRANQLIKTGIMSEDNPDLNGYKLDFIIEGGTYQSYNFEYRKSFIHRLYYACNIFYEQNNNKNKNLHIREIKTLEEEQKINETSKMRIVGLSIETRPDTINVPLLKELRELGVTRIQIGIQHLDDEILKKINRRCYLKHTKRAIKLLLDNCFKVAVHYMPDLPGSSPEKDIEMWEQLFNNPDLCFDYVKVYPCMVMPYTKIKEWYDNGDYKPYSEELIELEYGNGTIKKVSKVVPVCADFLLKCKKYQRVERMLRDLPVNEQEGGCDLTNLRQVVQEYLESHNKGPDIKEIRYREIRDNYIDYSDVKMFITQYTASNGTEYFISYETKNEKYLLGFIRLRISNENERIQSRGKVIQELNECALIREIHIYGKTVQVGDITELNGNNTQHRGFGTNLLKKAEEIAIEHNFTKMAVISGVGVKNFYRKNGFVDGKYYLIKNLN